MKVKELIEQLQELNQDYDITIDGTDINWISTDIDTLGEEFYSIEN